MGDGICTLYSIASRTTANVSKARFKRRAVCAAVKIWVGEKLSGTVVYSVPSVLIHPN